MRRLIVKILKIFGITSVHQADEGGKAVDILCAQPVDVLITDWNMAPVDGMAVAEWVRTSPQSPDPFMPIVMISSLSEASRIARAFDAGVNEFLAKPVQPKEILTTLTNLVQQPRPFVRTANYFGPDRRRRFPALYDGPERRSVDIVPFGSASHTARGRLHGL
jgi:CheY-like chemotaxis protein